MQKFDIEIRNDKIKTYRVITLLIVILNFLFFIYFSFNSEQKKSALLSAAFILLYAGYRLFKSKQNRYSFYFDEWIFFLLMILWSDNYFIAILNMLLFLLYTIAMQKIIYSFDQSLISQKNFPWKKYKWHQLSNVILKDNLLTIDFKNNKIMQAEVTAGDINEATFNTFAKAKLNNPESRL